MPPIPAQEQFADVAFPAQGLDLSQGFGSQSPGTTRLGANVRLFDAPNNRARGASRPGLAKYGLTRPQDGTQQADPGAYLVTVAAATLVYTTGPGS